jgi:hypothetical protein
VHLFVLYDSPNKYRLFFDKLGFVTETGSVYCAVRTVFLKNSLFAAVNTKILVTSMTRRVYLVSLVAVVGMASLCFRKEKR